MILSGVIPRADSCKIFGIISSQYYSPFGVFPKLSMLRVHALVTFFKLEGTGQNYDAMVRPN
jgi:hypothetical protein